MKNLSSGAIFLITAVVGVVLIFILVASTNNNINDNFSLPLQIEEYFDYDCSHCRAFSPSMSEIKSKYGSDVEVTYIYYPVIPSATNPGEYSSIETAYAAEAAREQGKYVEFYELTTKKLEELSKSKGAYVYSPELDLEAIAKELGLDLAKYNTDRKSETIKARIQDNIKQGNAKAVTGTPTIFIDGIKADLGKYTKLVAGEYDYSAFVTRVGEIINNLKNK